MKPAEMSDAGASSDFTPAAGVFKGWHFLAIMVSFFGVIIAVNTYMMTWAVGTFGGLVTPNSYVASQMFEEDQAAQRASAIAGWTIDASHAPVTEGGAALILEIARDGAPLTAAGLSADAGRPSHAREDRVLAFREVAPGRYVSTDPLPLGQWRVTLLNVAADGDAVERRSLRVHVRAPRGAS